VISEDEERCLSAIKKTLQFYNKSFDDNTRQFWRYYLRQIRNAELFLDALRQYPATGRYAPRPADISAIIEEIRPPKSTVKQAEIIDDCPAEIREAWSYWIPRFWNRDLPFKTEVDEDKAEQYLITVNQEAKRTNTPEAIPETHKLTEVWG
jgi:hypothetical protein